MAVNEVQTFSDVECGSDTEHDKEPSYLIGNLAILWCKTDLQNLEFEGWLMGLELTSTDPLGCLFRE